MAKNKRNMRVTGTCKLCNNESILQKSHIVPSFIGKWLKNTSITPYFRHSDSIEKRSQNLIKDYWLCRKCEDLFQDWERGFASNAFHPFSGQRVDTISYQDWMSKFCASISWRTLSYLRNKDLEGSETEEYLQEIRSTEETLASYLLGNAEGIGSHKQYLIPLGLVSQDKGQQLPRNINQYFSRGIGLNIFQDSNEHFIYTKIPHFIILYSFFSTSKDFMSTYKVGFQEGEVRVGSQELPDGLTGAIFSE